MERWGGGQCTETVLRSYRALNKKEYSMITEG